jgi:RNA polymerase sigma-70 factor (ECF subfamily)
MRDGAAFRAESGHEALRDVLSRAIARHCPRWLSDQKEDLVQAAVVRILEQERRPGGESVRTATYAWKVAYSVVVDEIRRRRNERERPLEDAGDPASSDAADRSVAGRERGEALRDCLGRLVLPRRVAVMVHLQGHRLEEGAALAGWSVKRHANLVYRGLADLRRCLGAKGITS